MVGITGGSDTALLQVAAANSHRFAGVVALRLNWNADVRITGADLSAENLYRGTSFLGTNTPNSRAHDGARFVVKAANGEDVDISLFPSAVTSHISAATTIAGSLN